MKRKKLRTNDFGKPILDDYEAFEYHFKTVKHDIVKNPDIYSARFTWSWNGYVGSGEIDFYYSNKSVCNSQGNNYSNMTITSAQTTVKRNCALYNDKALEILFSRMILSEELDRIILSETDK